MLDGNSVTEVVPVHDEETPSKKIRVVDRRWFTEDGELRPDRRLSSRPAPESPEQASPAPPGGGPREEAPRPAPPEGRRETPPGEAPGEAGERGAGAAGVGFLALVDFLAQQALVLLSGAHGVERNPEQARIFIDFLGVLEEKTRGNLTPEEARLLTDVLFQLRTLFVQAAR